MKSKMIEATYPTKQPPFPLQDHQIEITTIYWDSINLHLPLPARWCSLNMRTSPVMVIPIRQQQQGE